MLTFDGQSIYENVSNLYKCILRAQMSDKDNLIRFTTIVSVNNKAQVPTSCVLTYKSLPKPGSTAYIKLNQKKLYISDKTFIV